LKSKLWACIWYWTLLKRSKTGQLNHLVENSLWWIQTCCRRRIILARSSKNQAPLGSGRVGINFEGVWCPNKRPAVKQRGTCRAARTLAVLQRKKNRRVRALMDRAECVKEGGRDSIQKIRPLLRYIHDRSTCSNQMRSWQGGSGGVLKSDWPSVPIDNAKKRPYQGWTSGSWNWKRSLERWIKHS
jgi:hypothetical protein